MTLLPKSYEWPMPLISFANEEEEEGEEEEIRKELEEVLEEDLGMGRR